MLGPKKFQKLNFVSGPIQVQEITFLVCQKIKNKKSKSSVTSKTTQMTSTALSNIEKVLQIYCDIIYDAILVFDVFAFSLATLFLHVIVVVEVYHTETHKVSPYCYKQKTCYGWQHLNSEVLFLKPSPSSGRLFQSQTLRFSGKDQINDVAQTLASGMDRAQTNFQFQPLF